MSRRRIYSQLLLTEESLPKMGPSCCRLPTTSAKAFASYVEFYYLFPGKSLLRGTRLEHSETYVPISLYFYTNEFQLKAVRTRRDLFWSDWIGSLTDPRAVRAKISSGRVRCAQFARPHCERKLRFNLSSVKGMAGGGQTRMRTSQMPTRVADFLSPHLLRY